MTEYKPRACWLCHGSGMVNVSHDENIDMEIECSLCGGTGHAEKGGEMTDQDYIDSDLAYDAWRENGFK